MDNPLNRRRFLSVTALTAGAAALPNALFSGTASAAVPPQVTLPDRGIHDTSPASSRLGPHSFVHRDEERVVEALQNDTDSHGCGSGSGDAPGEKHRRNGCNHNRPNLHHWPPSGLPAEPR